MWVKLLAAVVPIVVVVGSLWVRAKTNGKVALTLSDALIAAICVALVLLISGQISKFTLGPQGLDIQAAILDATDKKIQGQIAPLPVQTLSQQMKGGRSELSSIVKNKTPALDLVIGRGFYNPTVFKDYLDTLAPLPFFRFVVLVKPDKSLVGLYEIQQLRADIVETPASPGPSPSPMTQSVVATDPSTMSLRAFVDTVNSANEADLGDLVRLKGFVPASAAVKVSEDKSVALRKMEDLGRDWLPVVAADGQLAGTVERSRLVASILLDISSTLKQ